MHRIDALPPGLVAVVGDEQTGKTTYLRRLSGDAPASQGDVLPAVPVAWCDLSLTASDAHTPQHVVAQASTRAPAWDAKLAAHWVAVWGLAPHMEKPLYMLSTGSRRKVALLTLLASGAPVVCLDQPYAALDMASIRALREYLLAQAEHPLRTWVIADYAVDEALLWRIVITLPTR